MNLFELFVKIGVKDEASSEVDKIGSKLKSGFVAAGKVAAAGIGAATTAIGFLSKASISAYADYEQLVGGVETLFKESAGVIEDYAWAAYETAGMSANEYMETVTSFSASLLQGLGGDTAAAAEYANKAVVDMADNANKMGTSIDLIQNAYQGFAKQNYTMLDNLKLGYGGTQAEMARLINDSGVLGDTMEVTAKTVNEVSFDKIIEAIHVMQERMGIAGTTSKEAASTISGSIASMKGQFQNLMTAIAAEDWDVGVFVDNFADSVVTVVNNIAPRLMELLPNITSALDSIVASLSPYIVPLIQTLLPSLIEGAITLVTGVAANIPDLVQILFESLVAALGNMFEALSPEMQDRVLFLFDAFKVAAPIIAGVTAAVVAFRTAMTISALIDTASKAITAFKTANEAATIAQAALNAVMNLNPFVLIATLIAGVVAALVVLWTTNEDFRNAVIKIWGEVVDFLSGVIDTIGKFFTETLPNAFNAVVNFFKDNWQDILLLLVNPFAGAFNLLYNNFAGFRNTVDNLVNNVKNAFYNMANGIADTVWRIRDNIVNGISYAVDWIKRLPGEAWEWGSDMINGFADGIMSAMNWLLDRVRSIASSIRSYLHFSRPDVGPLRDYETWMPDMMKGLAQGIDRNLWRVEDAAQDVSGALAFGVSGGGIGGTGAGARTGSFGAVNITVNAAPGQNARQIAQQVMVLIENERERRAASLA